MTTKNRTQNEISVFGVYAIYSSVVWGYVFSKCQAEQKVLDNFIIRDKCLPVGIDWFSDFFMRFISFFSSNNTSDISMMVSVSMAICFQLLSIYLWINFIMVRLTVPNKLIGLKKILFLFMVLISSHWWIYSLFNDYMTKLYVIISGGLFYASIFILAKDSPLKKIGILRTS
ncbi:MAG: hypothetical protein HGB23_01850 [Chlorobiaceae bacterium]|nr:hypothetical protein [Chlorobiaceae bacterium]